MSEHLHRMPDPHVDLDASVGDDEHVREQDRFLPIANINRIMKKALTDNAKVAKEAKETMQECVSDFISFITSEASEKLQQDKRKTINGDDILWAMRALGFDKYVEPLQIYLNKYREATKTTDKSAVSPAAKRQRRHSDENIALSYQQHAGMYGMQPQQMQMQPQQMQAQLQAQQMQAQQMQPDPHMHQQMLYHQHHAPMMGGGDPNMQNQGHQQQ